VVTLNKEKDSKCYVCGRDQKEFISIFNAGIYDKEIFDVESEISRSLNELSANIKSVLKKTESYDEGLSIREMMESEGISAKFVPEWKLLLKYLTPQMIEDIKSKGRPLYTVSSIRTMLTNAAKELDNGNHPVGIELDERIFQKEKDLQGLKLKKERLENFIADPGYKTYQTVLEKAEDQNENIKIKFKLCPICSDLHTTYHNSIKDDDYNDDNQGWE